MTEAHTNGDDLFHRSMIVTMMVVVLAGFVPGIVDPSSRKAPPTLLVGIHGLVFLSWPLLFLVQSTLISTRRIAAHRRLGVAMTILAVLMIGIGYATTVAMGRRGYDLSGDLNAAVDPLAAMVFPLGDLAAFGVLLVAGLWYRRRAEIHKRLMLLATVGGLTPAPLAHVIGHAASLREHPDMIVFPLAILFFAAAVHDRISLGKFHPVSFWGGGALLAWAALRATLIGPGAAWHRFAGWLIG